MHKKFSSYEGEKRVGTIAFYIWFSVIEGLFTLSIPFILYILIQTGILPVAIAVWVFVWWNTKDKNVSTTKSETTNE